MRILAILMVLVPFILFGELAYVYAETTSHTIVIRNFTFFPSDPVIRVGDTVIWKNEMNHGHQVVSGSHGRADGEFASYLLLKGHTFSHTFREQGEYVYHCPVHSTEAKISVVDPETLSAEKTKGQRAAKNDSAQAE